MKGYTLNITVKKWGQRTTVKVDLLFTILFEGFNKFIFIYFIRN